MKQTLDISDALGRANNVNLIKFIAAMAVIWGHAFGLTHDPASDPVTYALNRQTYSGAIAVGVFFFLSGFLVTRSFYFTPDLKRWALSRFLRIYPALWLCLTLSFVVIFIGYLPVSDIGGEVGAYFFFNATLIEAKFFITGLFEGNAKPGEVNGNLWTLPGEMRLYLLVFVLAALGLLSDRTRGGMAAPVLTLCGLLLICLVDFSLFPFMFDYQSFRPLSILFVLGCLALYLRRRIVLNVRIFLLVTTLFWTAAQANFGFDAAFIVFVAYGALYLAYGAPELRAFNRLGDYSYGLYLYGYFIQQIVAGFDPDQSAPLNALISAAITLPIAILSWHFVEQPALGKVATLRAAMDRQARGRG